jgi:hypothetical protein
MNTKRLDKILMVTKLNAGFIKQLSNNSKRRFNSRIILIAFFKSFSSTELLE